MEGIEAADEIGVAIHALEGFVEVGMQPGTVFQLLEVKPVAAGVMPRTRRLLAVGELAQAPALAAGEPSTMSPNGL